MKTDANDDNLMEMQAGLEIHAPTPEDLDNELIRQAQLYGHCGTLFAMAVAQRDARKHDLDLLEAELDHDVREQLAADGERITESKVEAAIKLEQRHQRAHQTYLDARYNADRWEALKEAYRQRAYMLREIANLRATDYFGEAVGSKIQRQGSERAFRRRVAIE